MQNPFKGKVFDGKQWTKPEPIYSSSGPGTVQILETKKTMKPPIKRTKTITPKPKRTAQTPMTPDEQQLYSFLERAEEGIYETPPSSTKLGRQRGRQRGRVAYDTKPAFDHPVRAPMQKQFFSLFPLRSTIQDQSTYQKQFQPPAQSQYFSLAPIQIQSQSQAQLQSQDQDQIQPQVPIQEQISETTAINIQAQAHASGMYPYTNPSLQFKPIALFPSLPKQPTKPPKDKKKRQPTDYGRYSIHYNLPDIWKAPQYTKAMYKRKKPNER